MKYLIFTLTCLPVFSCIAMEAPRVNQQLGDREFISLAEAIMTGSFKASLGQLEYTDYEADPEKPPFKTFACAISLANQAIYTSLHEILRKLPEEEFELPTCNHPLAICASVDKKLLEDSTAPIKEQEIKSQQTLRLQGFICGLDLKYEKMLQIKRISKSTIPDYEKERQKQKVKDEYDKIVYHRALYKAALASQNEAAINEERVKELRLGAFETIAAHLEQRRKRAVRVRQERENPLSGCQKVIQ